MLARAWGVAQYPSHGCLGIREDPVPLPELSSILNQADCFDERRELRIEGLRMPSQPKSVGRWFQALRAIFAPPGTFS